MKSRETLYLLPALEARECGEAFELTHKFMDGVNEYVKRWHGRVVVLVAQAQSPSSNLDTVLIEPSDVCFGLEWRPQSDVGLSERIADAGLVLTTLVHRNTGLPQICGQLNVPLVYITEYSVQTRCQIVRAETTNPLLRLRRQSWTKRLERRYEQAVRGADGVQCNGTPTFSAYQSINRRPLLYFDSRVRRDLLACSTSNARNIRLTGPVAAVARNSVSGDR